MNLLAELYNNQQNITQNPTGTIRTPRQIAYDNWLNAQQQAQNTTKDEWGQAIGNSVNGLAKIISSAVVKNPYERAGATRNLDNFDARQDALVRQWAIEQAKKRNDFVNQAREQLGMAKADEEQAYNRQQDAYKKMIDERNFNNIVKQQEIANKWKELDDINRREAAEQAKIQQDIQNKRIAENDLLDRAYKQAQIDKLNRENNPEYILQQQEQAQKEAEDKANQEQMKKNQERVFTLLNNNSVSPEDAMVINNNPELYKYLKDDSGIKNKIPIIGSKKKLELDYEAILKDQNIPVTRKNIKELKKQLGL